MSVPWRINDIKVKAQIWGHCWRFILCYFLCVLFYQLIFIVMLLVLSEKTLSVCCFSSTCCSKQKQIELTFLWGSNYSLLLKPIFNDLVLRSWFRTFNLYRLIQILCKLSIISLHLVWGNALLLCFLFIFLFHFLLFCRLRCYQVFHNSFLMLFLVCRGEVIPFTFITSTLVALRAWDMLNWINYM